MMSAKLRRRLRTALAAGLVLSLAFAGAAEARRGGSFGSRGMRTYQAPRTTATAPYSTGPVQRSMTSPNQPGYAPGYAPGYQQPGYGYGYRPPQPSFWGRWGGPIMGGLFAAGLFSLFRGHGFGGGFGGGIGFLALLIQIGVIVLLASLAMRFFRRGQAGAPFGGPAAFAGPPEPFMPPQPMPFAPSGHPSGPWGPRDEIGLGQADFDAFERLLVDIQGAFGREDYAALRERTTPEVMSYLAEELSQNAVSGRRNEVHDVRLLGGDLAEAWNEGDRDYATVAMRYSSVELMRDRADGRVVEGDEAPTETTEIWTFVRERTNPWGAAPWKLSAIQDARA
jgi:predicted lipid-binding transport protein (Tim44 family)